MYNSTYICIYPKPHQAESECNNGKTIKSLDVWFSSPVTTINWPEGFLKVKSKVGKADEGGEQTHTCFLFLVQIHM